MVETSAGVPEVFVGGTLFSLSRQILHWMSSTLDGFFQPSALRYGSPLGIALKPSGQQSSQYARGQSTHRSSSPPASDATRPPGTL